jgi:hypothetical protein
VYNQAVGVEKWAVSVEKEAVGDDEKWAVGVKNGRWVVGGWR